MRPKEIIEEQKGQEADSISIVEARRWREAVREIIEYQKSLYSASVSSSADSRSLLGSVQKTNSLFGLMRSGSASLRRLFDMEHTSLATYFEDYSGSPMIKPLFLWESDLQNEIQDEWAFVKPYKPTNGSSSREEGRFSLMNRFNFEEFGSQNRIIRIGSSKLTRKRSFRRLPRIGLWTSWGSRFTLRLRKHLRIVCCRRK